MDSNKTQLFTFGEPEPVLKTDMASYLGVFLDTGGDYYRPPIDLDSLVKLMSANSYHGTILHFKKNMLKKWFEPSPLLSGKEFEKLALNYIVTGNGYVQRLTNGFGKTVKLVCQPSLIMRRAKKTDTYLRLNDGINNVFPNRAFTQFAQGEIIHLAEPDLKQSIYGIPEYIGGIQSVLLSEESTLFRRKFILNGSHLGYILVTNDADIDDATAKEIEAKIKESKGPGNFRSLYMNIGKSNAREPVKVIPIGDIGTKDEFEAVKGITEREMLAMHRMQPGLSGVIPQNVAGFGDINKVMQVYYELEITAMQLAFYEINEQVGAEVVRFKEPIWTVA